ncbi:hypothetical protein CFC21_058314 [Triticum aestivum]|uniref:Uncharacterized protein n=3 Tax=Triticum TaxID=4564 RepID=A0A9R0T6B7_TRITD|nr:uncharacterized protein At1g01500-like [Triticum dicoccoides]XP_037425709.1 uncharacterized protein At1g01500-like [Triticum dicoccoides]XP_044370660.1 uncharacterized protein At1g01500-like [Triticum aestivum]XP_044370661.1 uncharacterized protein At1g01500-like [Triticum aestivum]VAI08015.1 unnamed protein product [Triticum turgidum subsp. durum]KAF7049854.1 hypothetical protein CFC21_058314 [Triticum aestivum]
MGEIPEPEVPKPTPEPSSWLSLRVFYLRLSRCELDETMLDTLSITHAPLTSDTVLEVNGDRPRSTDNNGHVSCPLRRDRVDAASREASFVSTATVRMAGSVRFEVRVGSGERLLVGIMEMCDVAEEKKKGWVMKCQVAMQRCSGFLKGGGEDAKSPMVEVYVASLFRGSPIVFTKAMKLRLRRTRQVKAPFMEPIPECGEHADDDAKETPPDQKHDPQESEYRCYKPEPGMDDVDYDSLYARSAGLDHGLDGEDSELSWFTAGVRVGVGISLGIFLGVGIGAGLLARSYQSTSRTMRRRLISGLL